MGLADFLKKQFIDVIQWVEPDDSVLAYRFPMQDMEIQMGAQLTVRESQMAIFVNEGRVADVFGPGLYRLETQNLPLLTNLMHWDKGFESPFKSDVYFFSTRHRLNQRWGTTNPVTIRDRDFGMVRLRGFGTYSYRIADPRVFHTKVSGTRDTYRVADLEPQLRNLVVSRMAQTFASSNTPFLDMAANQTELARQMAEQVTPSFAELGLALEQMVVENLSLPEELQKRLDERIGMNMIGDLNKYTQFQVGQSIPTAAANPGGGAGLGAGLGAGVAMGQAMVNAMQQQTERPGVPASRTGPGDAAGAGAGTVRDEGTTGRPPGTAGTATKFCHNCGKPIPRTSKFCPECGASQAAAAE